MADRCRQLGRVVGVGSQKELSGCGIAVLYLVLAP